MKRFIFLVVAVVAIAMSFVIDRPENWVLDPKTLQTVAKRGIAVAHAKHGVNATAEQVVESVIQEVTKTYPLHTSYSGRWLWNNAGGAMGSMTVLHSSFSEYLIIFGTSLGTEGHTGRYHWAEDFFTILYGEQWASLPRVAEAEVYKPGDQHYLPRHTAKQYRMPNACWALEYARGNIPSMLFFGLADGFTSTLDVVTLFQTVRESAWNMLHSAILGKI
ncbi:C-8 sterol isomerase [Trypanosoma conorhini]|uniref:C-8 sterol isomerase n=1 Tax=Trypanosoma conorhini TaxID=83891 RepID=A0A422P0D8_9TRYP|nr:C-8 sterol isomerase [Trypanosoma conorhini]RNF11213.1 C-8 sterol isomerase [Trypanosoma conorhini]